METPSFLTVNPISPKEPWAAIEADKEGRCRRFLLSLVPQFYQSHSRSMGRRCLKMEIIENEKVRMNTFKKRKRSLFKKAYEFSTLCGVDTAVIVCGPGGSSQPEIWPESYERVLEIIDKYHKTAITSRKKTFQLSDFLTIKKKRVDAQIDHTRNKTRRVKYPRWDDSFNTLSADQLRMLAVMVEGKMETMLNWINALKLHRAQSQCHSNQLNLTNNYGTELYLPPLPLSCPKPLEVQPHLPFLEPPRDCHGLLVGSNLLESKKPYMFHGNEGGHLHQMLAGPETHTRRKPRLAETADPNLCQGSEGDHLYQMFGASEFHVMRKPRHTEITDPSLFKAKEVNPYGMFGGSDLHLMKKPMYVEPYPLQGNFVFNNVNPPVSFYPVGPGALAQTMARTRELEERWMET